MLIDPVQYFYVSRMIDRFRTQICMIGSGSKSDRLGEQLAPYPSWNWMIGLEIKVFKYRFKSVPDKDLINDRSGSKAE